METIKGIVAEMREFADTDSQSIGRDVLRRRIQHFADRIEEAHKREIEDVIAATVRAAAESAAEVYEPHIQSELSGNAAKMRDALLKIRKAMDEMSKSIFQGWIEDGLVDVMGEAQRAISSALSAPPRNSDRFDNWKDAFQAFYKSLAIEHPPMSDGVSAAFLNWLFAEAKGGTK